MAAVNQSSFCQSLCTKETFRTVKTGFHFASSALCIILPAMALAGSMANPGVFYYSTIVIGSGTILYAFHDISGESRSLKIVARILSLLPSATLLTMGMLGIYNILTIHEVAIAVLSIQFGPMMLSFIIGSCFLCYLLCCDRYSRRTLPVLDPNSHRDSTPRAITTAIVQPSTLRPSVLDDFDAFTWAVAQYNDNRTRRRREQNLLTINEGKQFIVDYVLPTMKSKTAKEAFEAQDPGVIDFILKKAIFEYTLGSLKKARVPLFFEENTRVQIAEFRKHYTECGEAFAACFQNYDHFAEKEKQSLWIELSKISASLSGFLVADSYPAALAEVTLRMDSP